MNISINRRQFLGFMLASGFAPNIFARPHAQHEYWISAQGNRDDRYGLTRFDASGNRIDTTLSGFRGHGSAQHPLRPSSVIMFSRRPGTHAIDIDVTSGEVVAEFHARADRCFTGHGCFSQDGKLLYTVEADIHTGEGKIVIRDSHSYRQLGEFDSYGIGPHQMLLMPDGKTLVVANGGILTRPETGRKKLNLDSMISSLAYIDSRNGQCVDQQYVAESKASIRHLDVADDGTVAIAMQVQRSAMQGKHTVALGAVHKPGNNLRLLQQPEGVIRHMNDYAGSVTINNRTRVVGFTSPKGNLAAFWHLDSGAFAAYHQFADVCGLTVSADRKHFVLSNSFGALRLLDASTLKENRAARKTFADTHWDNHMITVTL